ncbi:MAG: aldehyde ferredoxin oxidoreductase family protein [Candidatus Bathyarchaeota archaeon]
MPFGYAGKILRVNLSTDKVSEEKIPELALRKYVGGRGLAASILFKEVKSKIDPLGSANKLVFATGPFENTIMPGGSRYVACGKSPLTGGWGESHAAGVFGSMMKKSGYDVIIIEGKANSPVYIWVVSGEAEVRDGSKIWGLHVGDTDGAVKKETNANAAVACIGIAGENLVRFSSIISECDRCCGRSGMGALMGSKKLKAIAVWGDQKTAVHDEDRLRELARVMNVGIKLHPLSKNFGKYGTAASVGPHNAMGIFPVKNFQAGVTDEIEKVTGETMAKDILVGRKACQNCVIGCRRHVKVKTSDYEVDPKYGGPEFETIGVFGPMLQNTNLASIAMAHQLCNIYGLDVINTGIIIAWVMECFERRIITVNDTCGLKPKWGDYKVIFQIIEKIAKREGFGNLLSQGLKEVSQKIGKGSIQYAMQVKNQAMPVHDPRGKISQGLSYAVSNRGACHLQGMHDTSIEAGNVAPEIGIGEKFRGLGRMKKEGKAELTMLTQNWRSIEDSLIICKFIPWDYGPVMPKTVCEALNLITSWHMTVGDMMKVGERSFNLCRMFNVREGFSRKDDTLPPRMAESLPRGGTKGSTFTGEDLAKLLDEYYMLRGWDNEGIPTKDKLRELGIEVSA